jgi:hypothetical protein
MSTAVAALALGMGLVGLNTGTAVAEGVRCHGEEVVTCTFIVFDGVSNVAARGSITDAANDGHAFQVKVEYLRLERRVNGGPWEQVRWMHDLADGFEDNYDVATTNQYVCGPGTEVRSVARFTWKGVGEKTQWQVGKPTPCGRTLP